MPRAPRRAGIAVQRAFGRAGHRIFGRGRSSEDVDAGGSQQLEQVGVLLRNNSAAQPAAEFDAPLADRYARAQAGLTTENAEDDAAREILVGLEFLAGIDSPAEDRQLRMNRQVQRLSSRMRDGAGANPERELSELLTRWFEQAPQTPALEGRFEVAAKAAIDSLP